MLFVSRIIARLVKSKRYLTTKNEMAPVWWGRRNPGMSVPAHDHLPRRDRQSNNHSLCIWSIISSSSLATLCHWFYSGESDRQMLKTEQDTPLEEFEWLVVDGMEVR